MKEPPLSTARYLVTLILKARDQGRNRSLKLSSVNGCDEQTQNAARQPLSLYTLHKTLNPYLQPEDKAHPSEMLRYRVRKNFRFARVQGSIFAFLRGPGMALPALPMANAANFRVCSSESEAAAITRCRREEEEEEEEEIARRKVSLWLRCTVKS